MALIEFFEAPAKRREAKKPQQAADKPRTRGLFGRMTAEQKAAAFTYEGDITCGPIGAPKC